jgi:hypothetical protein
VLQTMIAERGAEHGFSYDQLKRAKRPLSVRSFKKGTAPGCGPCRSMARRERRMTPSSPAEGNTAVKMPVKYEGSAGGHVVRGPPRSLRARPCDPPNWLFYRNVWYSTSGRQGAHRRAWPSRALPEFDVRTGTDLGA